MSAPELPVTTSEDTSAVKLATLYVEYGPDLRRFVAGVLGDQEAAKDVLQATFAKAAESAGDVPEASMKSWLFQVAFREALTVKRRAAVDQRAKGLLGRSLPIGSESADILLARGETVERVRHAMQELPEAEQRVVRARVYDNKTFAQIAAELHVPLGTVLSRMRRALEKLKTKLS